MEPQTRHRKVHSYLQRILKSRYAPCLTHASLAVLTILFFAMLVAVPFWLAFLPGVMIAHRIGVLLHEYFHGIPFRRYRDNLVVLTCFDGLMLMFGLLELVRGTHLAHHRWLNTGLDPSNNIAIRLGSRNTRNELARHPAVQHLIDLTELLGRKKPYVRAQRILWGAALSVATILFWSQLGHPEVVWRTLAITGFTIAVPVLMRGAIEHYSYPGDPNFANEYRVLIPLFNINRHIHHHEEPTVPWYLLKFRTEHPLQEWSYFTHWFRVNVKHDFVLMQPMSKVDVKSRQDENSLTSRATGDQG